MKFELMVPEEFANLIAEKVVEKIMPLLEAKRLQPSITQHNQKDIDPMRAMSEREVSHLIGKSVSTLRNDRSLGRGVTYFKVGRTVRYRRGEVLKWLEAQRIEPRR